MNETQSLNSPRLEDYKAYLKEKRLTPQERIDKISLLDPSSNLDAFKGATSAKNIYHLCYQPSKACDELRTLLDKVVMYDTKLWKKAGIECAKHFKMKFETIKSCKNREEIYLSSYNYALSSFREQLTKISDHSFEEIKAQCTAYSISYVVSQYFDIVSSPQKGDLVVYWDNSKSKSAGLYQGNAQVESKWTLDISGGAYVHSHPLFFIPGEWGGEATFYRPKSSRLAPLNYPPFKIDFITKDKGIEYKKTERNDLLRVEIDQLSAAEIDKKFIEIHQIKDINFFGVCYHYAFGKVLKTYVVPKDALSLFQQSFLDRNFTRTQKPQKGDLTVYYEKEGGRIVHFGVYISDSWIESKWGPDSVFHHPPFHVPTEYGSYIEYYRKK